MDRAGYGLIETMRVRGGRIPFLERHLARLDRSLKELGLPRPARDVAALVTPFAATGDRKSTRLNSSHLVISYAVFCLKKKITSQTIGNKLCWKLIRTLHASMELPSGPDRVVPGFCI